MRFVAAGIMMLGLACGEGGGGVATPDSAPETTPDAGAAEVDAAAPDARPELVLQAPFSVASGRETWLCLRRTMTEDVQVAAFEPTGRTGVHHSLLAVHEGLLSNDGVAVCGPELAAHRVLFAAGRNTPRLELPGKAGFQIKRGETLLVHLHLFNTTETVLSGSAGFRLTTVAASEVVHRADMVLAGNVQLVIPPGTSTHLGRCSILAPATLIAVAPHMHQLGVRQRVSLVRGGEEQTLLDDAFDFEAQPYTLMQHELKAGDVVRVACTYDNYTDETVYFGGSSTDEMCYARLLFYPPGPYPVVCVR